MAPQNMAEFEEGHGTEHPLPLPAARAYVTLLPCGRAGYGEFQKLGAVRLVNALREAPTAYPLVVAVPPDAPEDLRIRLAREGCVVREVYPPKYTQPGHFADEGDDINYHYKLCCLFQFADYEKVVCLDAARVQALENMDDLFELDKGFLYAWMEFSAGDKAIRAPQHKIAYRNGDYESPDMLTWPAVDTELAALICNAAVLVHEPGTLFGEALLGKNLAGALGAPSTDAPMSARDPGTPLGEPLLGKNCAAGLVAPYSNTAATSPYSVQVFIDESTGAKTGDPIAVGAKTAGADAGDAQGRAGNLSAVVGIIAASSAVTVVAASTVSSAVAFGFFVVLLGGLCVAMSTVRGA